ncbi:membrane protein [Staphylococcus virus vB_SurM-PSU5]|nr:membrane protein [Staphylococcus virus vB_SurM-PSU5]
MGITIVNLYFILSSILFIVLVILNGKGTVTKESLAMSKALMVITSVQFLAFLIINGIYYSLKYM